MPTAAQPPVFEAERLAEAAEILSLRLVVAFGSRAGGRLPPRTESDLEVAVLRGRGPGDPAPFAACYRALSGVFPVASLDLAFLDTADPLFRHEIMRQGTLLHGDPDLFADYRSFAYRDFVDSEDLRLLEQRLFRKKMEYLRSELSQ